MLVQDMDENAEAIRLSLQNWRDQGVVDPIMPVFADVDGDGREDWFGLDAFGRLEYRLGSTAGFNVTSMFGAQGTGIEGPRSEGSDTVGSIVEVP